MPSIRTPVGDQFTLAAADDLNGDPANTATWLNADGAARVIFIQHNNGTAGTAGVDVIQVSKDGGKQWAFDATLKDNDGDAVANAALNAAGVEPVNMALFTGGPYDGPTLIRCARDATLTNDDNGAAVAWTTGAPSVVAIRIG